MSATAILFISLAVLLMLNVPIAVSMGLSSFLAILFGNISVPPVMMAQRVFTTLDSFPYMAVPFFILAGSLMEHGGMSRRLIDLAKCIVGRLPGGLAIITVVASGFFGALSGSNAATVAAIGGIMIPSMEKEGYPKDFAAATAAAAGTLGVVVPPSVPMVTYAVIANVSVGALFLAGFIPALFMIAAMFLVIFITAKRMGISACKDETSLGKAFARSIGALVMPVIILGGIYSGLCTPTEAAAVATVYAFVVSVFVYKEIKWKDLPKIIISSAKSTGMILFIIGTSGAFSWLLTNERIPDMIASAMLSLTTNPILILLLINFLLLILGVFLETNAIILLITPMLLPIITALGYSPLAFGIVMVVNTSVGMLTPPMAMNIMVASGISKLSIESISKRVFPYLGALILVIMLITYLPGTILFLPRLFGMPV